MPRRRIGREELFAAGERRSSLDDLLALIDWSEVAARLEIVLPRRMRHPNRGAKPLK